MAIKWRIKTNRHYINENTNNTTSSSRKYESNNAGIRTSERCSQAVRSKARNSLQVDQREENQISLHKRAWEHSRRQTHPSCQRKRLYQFTDATTNQLNVWTL